MKVQPSLYRVLVMQMVFDPHCVASEPFLRVRIQAGPFGIFRRNKLRSLHVFKEVARASQLKGMS